MVEVLVHKAEPAFHGATVDDVTLAISKRLPVEAGSNDLAGIYIGDASRIADALLAALPGGTVDQLLAELLRRRAVLFRVPFRRPPQTDGGGS